MQRNFFFPVFSPSLCNRTLNDSLTFTLTCLNMLSYPSLYSSQLKALLSETQVQLISAKAEAQEQRAELSLVSLTSVCLMLHMLLSTLSDSCAVHYRSSRSYRKRVGRQRTRRAHSPLRSILVVCIYVYYVHVCYVLCSAELEDRFLACFFSVFSSSSTCTSCVHEYICCVWVL